MDIKRNAFLSCLGAALFATCVAPTLAESSTTFKALASFDYPGATYTQGFKISDSGAVAGTATIGSTRFGFVRFSNGHFSQLITSPNDPGMTTFLTAFNSVNSYCGVYGGGDDHAFVVINHVLTEVQIPGAAYNYVWDINDSNDYCGSYYPASGPVFIAGYLSIGGNITTLSVPGDNGITSIEGINQLGQAVGYYSGGQNIDYGFFRDTDGTLTFPSTIPGIAQTYLEAVNDAGSMVGFVMRGAHYHGMFYSTPSQPTTFDYPGSTDTFIYGINNRGLISGVFYDQTGIHGFVARVNP